MLGKCRKSYRRLRILGFGGKVKSGVERFGLEGGVGAKKGAETRENEEDGKKETALKRKKKKKEK